MDIKKTLFAILLLLTACTTKAEHETSLNSWLGSSEDRLVETWGPPTGFYEKDETRYLTWSSSEIVIIGGGFPSYYNDYFGNLRTFPGTSPSVVNARCDITMIIKGDEVVSWQYKGNDCYDF